MRTRLVFYLAVISATLGMAVTAQAFVPHQINIQGILTDADGNPITSPVAVLFAIWNLPVGGDSLWSEVQSVAPDAAGRFNVLLGKISPIPDSAFHLEAFLSITVESFPELIPRQQLVSVAYAYRAKMAEEAGVSFSAAPGSVNSASIQDKSIGFNDIGQNSAAPGQVMKWNGADWFPGNDEIGSGGNGWVDAGTRVHLVDPADSVGIGTGAPGYKLQVVGQAVSGIDNSAAGQYSTVSGGLNNSADGDRSTIAGGESNSTPHSYTTVSGGWMNKATSQYATVGGGSGNVASNDHATVAGGETDTASGKYSTIGGGEFNTAASVAATVGGGQSNRAAEGRSTVSGGYSNLAGGTESTVGGGQFNTASGAQSVVAGGESNAALGWRSAVSGGFADSATGEFAAIGGGMANVANAGRSTVAGGYKNTASGTESAVSGGQFNMASGAQSVVAGGESNLARNWRSVVGGGYADSALSDYSVVGGGIMNVARDTGATVGGGQINLASGVTSTVSGGSGNRATGQWSTIAGGAINAAEAPIATVGGGGANRSIAWGATVCGGFFNWASGQYAVVGGGGGAPIDEGNSASGDYSVIPGGRGNSAQGENSFAAGRQAHATHEGSFVWADNTSSDFSSESDNEFAIRAEGGLRMEGNNTWYAARFENKNNDGDGVRAYANASSGLLCAALWASNFGTSPAIYATGYGLAGYFNGPVTVTGLLTKAGGGFKIDHPLDPANKYLNHSFVESPDMKNVYDGVVVLDAAGEAWVNLPAWFSALNRDFRYQLTPIGAPGPNLYIADEIANDRFRIAGGTAGMKVSWQVTGIRQDAWANTHRLPVEEDKAADEHGKYLHPKEYGQPESMGIGGDPAKKMTGQRE